MARNERSDSRSPREKRSSTEDPLKYSKGEVEWANDDGPESRSKQADPMRWLKSHDNP